MGQYYQVLQQQPDFAHQFYTDASNMIRVDGDSTESASALLVMCWILPCFLITCVSVDLLFFDAAFIL